MLIGRGEKNRIRQNRPGSPANDGRGVHDVVAQYARGEVLDERRNSVRLSLICLLDLSRQRILPDHLV